MSRMAVKQTCIYDMEWRTIQSSVHQFRPMRNGKVDQDLTHSHQNLTGGGEGNEGEASVGITVLLAPLDQRCRSPPFMAAKRVQMEELRNRGVFRELARRRMTHRANILKGLFFLGFKREKRINQHQNPESWSNDVGTMKRGCSYILPLR